MWEEVEQVGRDFARRVPQRYWQGALRPSRRVVRVLSNSTSYGLNGEQITMYRDGRVQTANCGIGRSADAEQLFVLAEIARWLETHHL